MAGQTQKLFASLHNGSPDNQEHREVKYKGYKRLEVEYNDLFGIQTVTLRFPNVEEEPASEDNAFNVLAIGENAEGPGNVLRYIECVPAVKLTKDIPPVVIVANIPEPLPEDMHPIAKVIWHLVNEKKMLPEDMDPKLFEVVNDEFAAHGVKIMTVTREGTAKMVMKMSQMKSFNLG